MLSGVHIGEPSTSLQRGRHLAFLINDLTGGGAERVLKTLTEFLLAESHSVTIYTLQTPQAAYIFDPRVRIVPFFTRFFCYGLMKALLLPIQALELWVRLGCSPVHALAAFQERSNFVAILAGFLPWSCEAKITEHTCPTLRYNRSTPSGALMLGLIRHLYPKAVAIQAVSQQVADSLCTLGISARQIQTLPNSIDVQALRRASLEANPLSDWIQKRPTIVTIGRLCPLKDQETLLRALVLVREVVDCQLLLIGTGPHEHFLRELVGQLGLADQVCFAGWQSNPYALLIHCQVFAFSSVLDGFGIAVIEAMACGLPVVTTNYPGGASEILQNGEFGIVTPVGDVAAMASALREVLTNPERAATLRKKSMGRAEKYDVSVVGRRFLEFLGPI